jgi:hypothetical protein
VTATPRPKGAGRWPDGLAWAVAGGLVVALVALGLGVAFPPTHASPAQRPYSLDGGFEFRNNDAVWDPNFVPGFGTYPTSSIGWTAPTGGPGTIDYDVRSATVPSSLPHFAVGPQAFNFVEVPRTQVYRIPSWGDYQYVAQGFNSCAVNLGNVTVTPASAVHPIYVGLPEAGTPWTATWSLQWQSIAVDSGTPAGSVA